MVQPRQSQQSRRSGQLSRTLQANDAKRQFRTQVRAQTYTFKTNQHQLRTGLKAHQTTRPVKIEMRKPSVKPERPKYPSNGQIRAIASQVSRELQVSDAIVGFSLVLRTYCGIVMGFTDRFSVGEYLYLELKKAVEDAKKRSNTFTVLDLQPGAMALIREIERHLLETARSGRRLPQALVRDGYLAVRGLTVNRRRFFLIVEKLEMAGKTKFFIVSLCTPGDFKRSQKGRLRGRRTREEREDLEFGRPSRYVEVTLH